LGLLNLLPTWELCSTCHSTVCWPTWLACLHNADLPAHRNLCSVQGCIHVRSVADVEELSVLDTSTHIAHGPAHLPNILNLSQIGAYTCLSRRNWCTGRTTCCLLISSPFMSYCRPTSLSILFFTLCFCRLSCVLDLSIHCKCVEFGWHNTERNKQTKSTPTCITTTMTVLKCKFHFITSVDGWAAMLQAGRPPVRVTMRSLNFFFNLPNPTGRTRPWGLHSF
jgi:hypothetical protein